jgi:acyl carrier protein
MLDEEHVNPGHSVVSPEIAEMERNIAGQSDTDAVAGEIEKLILTRFSWVVPPKRDLAAQRFREDLDLDSLHMVELQTAVEDHFAVIFDPEDDDLLDAFSTVGALASYVRRRRGEHR